MQDTAVRHFVDLQKCKWFDDRETWERSHKPLLQRFEKEKKHDCVSTERKLTIHKFCAYRYPVLYKKGTEKSDDVRRITLQSKETIIIIKEEKHSTIICLNVASLRNATVTKIPTNFEKK